MIISLKTLSHHPLSTTKMWFGGGLESGNNSQINYSERMVLQGIVKNMAVHHQFARGIPIYSISQILKKIISGSKGSPLLINGIKRPMPLAIILEIELYPTFLSKAISFGLSDKWIQALVKKDPVRHQVLQEREIDLLVGTDMRDGIGTTRT
ncbi:hypothetical protein Tco_0860963 [Tanacetum coccineum]|uniref:Uncharacterized protein n=1 Tax=Tanacetum coccineum TaxID=301880 RepID=A0ABQ5BJU6_9ASTR